jgi:ubiquinol-cytochrome c reductase cytochrome c1 subunit
MLIKYFGLLIFILGGVSGLAVSATKQSDKSSGQVRRGFQVFQEVCAACHGAELITAAKLKDMGISGSELSRFGWETGSGSPVFPSPYTSEAEAFAANNGAIPGDLSELYQTRQNGASYTFGILTSYQSPPPFFSRVSPRLTSGKHYNTAFKSRYISMPPPLSAEGQVAYRDGTPSTVEQMSRDVAVFLYFASEH